jgi:hypothetical protein
LRGDERRELGFCRSSLILFEFAKLARIKKTISICDISGLCRCRSDTWKEDFVEAYCGRYDIL